MDNEIEGKLWYQSRTMWVGVVEFLIGALGIVATFLHLGIYTPESIVLLVVGFLTILLRKLTEVPIVPG